MQRKVTDMLEFLQDLPIWVSSLLLIFIYSLALVFVCPGTPFNLASGFLYGIVLGCFVATLGCMLGATLAFLCGRTIGREWVKSKMEKSPKFKAVDWAIQKNGIYIVFFNKAFSSVPVSAPQLRFRNHQGYDVAIRSRNNGRNYPSNSCIYILGYPDAESH